MSPLVDHGDPDRQACEFRYPAFLALLQRFIRVLAFFDVAEQRGQALVSGLAEAKGVTPIERCCLLLEALADYIRSDRAEGMLVQTRQARRRRR